VGSGDTKLIIAFAEFLVVIIGLILGGEKWQGETIFYVGDNENVQQWLQERKAGTQYGRHLLRVLRHLEMTFGFSLVGFYARSKHNETADLLTRAEEEERKTSAAKHGLKPYPFGEALRLFTDYVEKGWARRAFVFRWPRPGPAEDRPSAGRSQEGDGSLVDPQPRGCLTAPGGERGQPRFETQPGPLSAPCLRVEGRNRRIRPSLEGLGC
jgi:hypothetical protein